MKNIILFGAGASYGSPHIRPESPPLGGNLFEKLAKLYPETWAALPPDYIKEFGNFEKGMLKVMESGNHWIGPLMQTMTLFFTSFTPDGSGLDLYSQLITKLRATGVIANTLFSTLNYECVLELAASQLGLSVNYNELPNPTNSVTVWKLHGSCNFIPNPQEISMRRGASYAWGVTVNVGLIPVSPSEAAKWVLGDNSLYPAMCMFTLNKPSQISPGVFAECQRKWAELAISAENVVLIGVKPHSPDKHIWEPLSATAAKLYFVGSESEFYSWSPARKNRKSCYLGPTFAEALREVSVVLA